MDLYKTLKLKPIRSEPDVWVSRLMIFERIAPDPVVIRDIHLTRGLNIIWAEEGEDDSPSAQITGHSAGKTTFCRFMRYALGERTFGTKTATELIRNSLPGGYIAAEIHVRGRRWAIRRPIGSGRMSFIQEDASVEELLEQRGRSVTQESYPHELGLESLLDGLETGGIVQTGELIQWPHLLAWCTRDQEARFQNIHEWRSTRSESDTPSFRFPKAGPLFVMRAVLGLFLPDELKGEERLAELQREKDRLAKEIEEKRREPQFRVNLYDFQLRQHLKSLFPSESDIDSRPFRSDELFPEDLERLTARARETIKKSIENSELERRSFQAQIDDLGAELRHLEREFAELNALFNLDTAAGFELEQGLAQRQEQRKRLEDYKDKACPVGGVLIRECTHVQERQQILQIKQLHDAHAMEQAEALRAGEQKKIEDEKARFQKSIDQIKEVLRITRETRDGIMAHIREQEDSIRNLQRTHDDLAMWMQKRDRSGGYEELDLLRSKLASVEVEIAGIEKELSALLRQHDENRERLAAIFSGAVRSVLSSDEYDGQVSLDNRELTFRITRGPAMSGEAVETLAVLLADVACLIYNTVYDKVRLPGFLMHDSPREADLGIRIYRSFIRFAASLQEYFGGPDKSPFQYLITTTTAPPEELQKNQVVRLRLNAASMDDLLLRRNIDAQTGASPGQLNFDD
jgi:hypothetical protein